MKLADQILVAMGEDFSLMKQISFIRKEVKKRDISKSDLLHHYDSVTNLVTSYPKSKKMILKLKKEIENKLLRS